MDNVLDLLKESRMMVCKPVENPMDTNTKLKEKGANLRIENGSNGW